MGKKNNSDVFALIRRHHLMANWNSPFLKIFFQNNIEFYN